jgi:hypothetical protein
MLYLVLVLVYSELMLGLIKGMWLGSLWVIITRETYQRLGRVRCIVAITPMWVISVSITRLCCIMYLCRIVIPW